VATKTTTHTYPGSGSFSVTLTVTDSAGRTGVTSKSVVVP
jgi:PKD repeat protein